MYVKIVQDSTKVEKAIIKMELSFREKHKVESITAKSFDEALMSIQTKLPDMLYMKNCWGCAFAEYSPVSGRRYGSLGCFRNVTEGDKLKDAGSIIRAWPKISERVQETYLCKQFARRTRSRFVFRI
jgi:hypothetical protein